MFYSIVLIVFGVFIGQEYTNVPSVKSLANSVTTLFTRSENTDLWTETIKKLLKRN